MFAGKPWGHSPLPAPKEQLLFSHLMPGGAQSPSRPGTGESQVSQPHLGAPGEGSTGRRGQEGGVTLSWTQQGAAEMRSHTAHICLPGA